MLQDIRQNVVKGPVAKVIIWLIVISFAAFGIESILLGGGSSGVAEVNGEEISPMELQQAVTTQKRRLIAMLGDQLDPALLDDQRISSQALQGLINRKLLMQAANDLGLVISERGIGQVIAGMEDFQEGGQFSPELYKALLAESGYTPAYFKQALREDLALNQLRAGLSGSEFTTPLELQVNARVVGEQRDVRYVTIPAENFRQAAGVSEAEIEQYYSDNAPRFLSEESVDLDYIELRLEDFFQPVDEQLVLEAYELERDSLESLTESRVSHILFEPGEEQQQRLEEAQARLASGAEFADVAGQFSDDIGSAASGGDLGYTSGDAFPVEMEDAIASLEPGVVSSPVATEAGIHLLLVTDRKEGRIPELDEVRDRLHADIQRNEARVALLRTVEQLRDLSFNADNLAEPASELDLDVERAEAITRSGAEGLFANPALVSAAFSEDVLEAGHNSEVIELAGTHFVVLRVRSHHQPEVRPLESVREEIVTLISAQRAREAVSREAERALAALRSGTAVEQFARDNGYEWQVEIGADRNNGMLPPPVLRRAFELPAPEAGGSISDYVMTPEGDIMVFELVRVTLGDLDSLEEEQRETLQAQSGAEYSGMVDTEFQQVLRDEADITVL
jgi:peptidyl-prolyl cis-trans isomerase D